MSRRLTLVAIAAAVLSAAPGARAAAARTLPGQVVQVAMDGPLVGASVIAKTGCQVVGWNVETGHRTSFGSCHDTGTSTGVDLDELTVAGQRVAWVVNSGGNTEQDEDLWAASLAQPRAHRVATASRFGSVDGGWLKGSWLAGLVGDASQLRIGAWTSSFDVPSNCDELNENPTAPCHVLFAGARLRAPGGPAWPLSFAPATWVSPQTMDSGRIAALTGDGQVAVLTPAGALSRLITPQRPLAAAPCSGFVHGPLAGHVALRKDRVAVITSARTLDVYDTGSGGLVHSYPVPALAARRCLASKLDTFNGYAAYAAGRALHLVKLATGKDRVVPGANGTAFQLDAPGLVYTTRTGLTFAPLARLRTLVG